MAYFRGSRRQLDQRLGYSLGYGRHGSTPTGGVHPGWMPPAAATRGRLVRWRGPALVL
jgi:hypothetical protein